MERLFIHTREFEDQIKAFSHIDGLLVDIEQEVFKDLEKSMSLRDIIAGSGGFTKLRVAFKSMNKGKSGSARVIYFDCPDPKRTFLIMIYSKAEFENISQAGKKALKQLGQELKKWQPKKKK